jgi:chromosomal replication initiation ATPase DnaA
VSARGQLPLPLDAAPRFGREDFLVGRANEAAFAQIARWPHWLAAAAILVGPEGSGKSHLAAIFAQASGARQLRADHLDPEAVPALAKTRALVLEDADRFPPDEVALFHLLNLARETGLSIVMTARVAPDRWGIRTPDLLSRLRLQPLLELAEPDDAMLGALIVKHFADRQINVEASVVTYAMARIERSYAAVQALVAALDRESLVRKKPVTRALAGFVLGEGAHEIGPESDPEPQIEADPETRETN